MSRPWTVCEAQKQHLCGQPREVMTGMLRVLPSAIGKVERTELMW